LVHFLWFWILPGGLTVGIRVIVYRQDRRGQDRGNWWGQDKGN
jgi:hypothetical protein